jgi:hypothetical protein
MTIQEQYEQVRAENQRKWAARRKKKEELEHAAAITLAGFESVVVGGRKPVGDREQWIEMNPQTALAYVDVLMKLGSYWDMESLALSVDDVASNVDR